MVMMMVVMLMTRRRRRIGIHPDGYVRDVYLCRWYDGGRRLRRGLHLLRATDRVAASFAAPPRPTDLTFPNGRPAVTRSHGRRRRDARRLHDFVPIGFAYRRTRHQVVPENEKQRSRVTSSTVQSPFFFFLLYRLPLPLSFFFSGVTTGPPPRGNVKRRTYLSPATSWPPHLLQVKHLR